MGDLPRFRRFKVGHLLHVAFMSGSFSLTLLVFYLWAVNGGIWCCICWMTLHILDGYRPEDDREIRLQIGQLKRPQISSDGRNKSDRYGRTRKLPSTSRFVSSRLCYLFFRSLGSESPMPWTHVRAISGPQHNAASYTRLKSNEGDTK